jgi:hypothetical protein
MTIFTEIISQPIRIIDVTEKGIDISLIISLIAICFSTITTVILVWKLFKKPEIYGKVLSREFAENGTLTYTPYGEKEITETGQLYILKLSLTCLFKTLNYKDIKAFVTYKNQERIEALIYWSKYDILSGKNNGNGIKKTMMIPADDFLPFNSLIEIGKTNFYYIKFIVPNKKGLEIYDKLELEFVKPNNKLSKVEIFEIDKKQFFFDETLFA